MFARQSPANMPQGHLFFVISCQIHTYIICNTMSDTISSLLAAAGNSIEVKGGHVAINNEAVLRATGIDALIHQAVFGEGAARANARWLIWESAQTLGILPSSIHQLYIARGQGRLPHTFTTPAMNIRMLTYDLCRAAFGVAVAKKVGAMIFELARSESSYTDQRPAEYVIAVLAAAIKEGFRGPVFVQGDHYQVNAKKYLSDKDRDGEITALKNLMKEAIDAGYYNIDIDTSTLVDLSKQSLLEQQKLNYDLCAMFSDYIRGIEPVGVTVSLGGEIGEVGHKNSDIHELEAFMTGFNRAQNRRPGLSKISVATGTSHGGTVMADGKIADVAIDFGVLKELTAASYSYGMGGAVQHGASTLPDNAFNQFVQCGAIEVHLATGFQTATFAELPKALNDEINAWLHKNAADERKAGDTDEQFLYKTRKKAIGPFKKQLWGLPDAEKAKIRAALARRFALYFERLGAEGTADAVAKTVTLIHIHKTPQDFGGAPLPAEDVEGLAD